MAHTVVAPPNAPPQIRKRRAGGIGDLVFREDAAEDLLFQRASRKQGGGHVGQNPRSALFTQRFARKARGAQRAGDGKQLARAQGQRHPRTAQRGAHIGETVHRRAPGADEFCLGLGGLFLQARGRLVIAHGAQLLRKLAAHNRNRAIGEHAADLVKFQYFQYPVGHVEPVVSFLISDAAAPASTKTLLLSANCKEGGFPPPAQRFSCPRCKRLFPRPQVSRKGKPEASCIGSHVVGLRSCSLACAVKKPRANRPAVERSSGRTSPAASACR